MFSKLKENNFHNKTGQPLVLFSQVKVKMADIHRLFSQRKGTEGYSIRPYRRERERNVVQMMKLDIVSDIFL